MKQSNSMLSRRSFLTSSAVAASAPAWLPSVAMAGSGSRRDVLVTIFLRGGADGLTMCVPYGDGDLYVNRPSLAIQPPGSIDGALDLDGFFGLAPASAPLLTPYQAGKLAIVHAVGSDDPSRSHFDAQFRMETATPNQPQAGITSGWLARHLQEIAPASSGPLRGMALSPFLPRALVGGPATLPVPDPASFGFPGEPASAAERQLFIGDVHQETVEPLRSAAASSIGAIDLLAGVDFAGYTPENGASYPAGEFGQRLLSTAALIKADVGLEVSHLDINGWDHHADMGPVNGILAGLLAELSTGLEAFYLDLLGELDRVTVVVMSEFGRRIRENGSAGTDHGFGGAMLVMGGSVNGGQVYGSWPGLDTSTGSGDLDTTTNYRDVLWEILAERTGATELGAIFPGFTPGASLGIVG